MKYISIFNVKVVKGLLKNDFIIKDIKPNPQNTDRTVFLFEETEEIKEYLKKEFDIKFN